MILFCSPNICINAELSATPDELLFMSSLYVVIDDVSISVDIWRVVYVNDVLFTKNETRLGDVSIQLEDRKVLIRSPHINVDVETLLYEGDYCLNLGLSSNLQEANGLLGLTLQDKPLDLDLRDFLLHHNANHFSC
eukprot:Lithocolla_globosa_v1_NODE_2451_length_1999_cov_15.808128.p4 type:complete len:136 gc:universal NODE_2451_length_1999_cov_15.808128:1357-1764(+)